MDSEESFKIKNKCLERKTDYEEKNYCDNSIKYAKNNIVNTKLSIKMPFNYFYNRIGFKIKDYFDGPKTIFKKNQ